VYLGIGGFNYYHTAARFRFIAGMVFNVLIGRLVTVYLVAFIIWIFKRNKFALTLRELGIFWLGGSIRGAVAFALILSLEESHRKNELISTTLVVVILTTVILGAFMPVWVWLLTPTLKENAHKDSIYIDMNDLRQDNEFGTFLITHPN
jgi:NhaP-type Na+/H+ or K+/H+ antiporter